MSARGTRAGSNRGALRRRDPLSRDERFRVYGTEAGFIPLQTEIRCPSCRSWELEADIELGTPRHDFAVNPGCDECGGSGMIPARGKQRIDPYATPHVVATLVH